MQTLQKRGVPLALLMALSLSVFGSAGMSRAKEKKPSLPSKVSVRVSQTKKLKIANVKKSRIQKTTWSVSGKKNVKLSAKSKDSVKLTGVKSGTAKIKAVVRMKAESKLSNSAGAGRASRSAKNAKKTKIYKINTVVKVTGGPVKETPGQTEAPTAADTSVPASAPAAAPTGGPTAEPTVSPTLPATPEPTLTPTIAPYTGIEDLPLPNTLPRKVTPPDVMTMWDGVTRVERREQWEARKLEIKGILQRYMYGMWRDGSEEEVTYSCSGDQMLIAVRRGGKKAEFKASVSCPKGDAPDGGWPVIVSVGGVFGNYMNEKGYATISFNPPDIASDNANRGGIFYELYPYDMSDWRQQTGAVMAWGWGASKIIDALENGAGDELGINEEYSIVTGVSRYGKAAAAAGAFEKRFKVSMPVCSGYGGLTMSRYRSQNLIYNLLPDFENDPKKGDVSDLSAWKSDSANEPISSLRGSGWYNESFKDFKSYQHLPFDSHYIAALSAEEGRYLFIVTGINSDMWSSPPGFWWTYELARPAFEQFGLSDNLAIQMHLNLHGIETEDLCKLFTYTDYHFYGKTTDPSTYPSPWNELLKDFTLDSLKTCIFATEANRESYEKGKRP